MNNTRITELALAVATVPFALGVLLATWRQRRAVARRSRELTIEVGPKVLLGLALTGASASPALATSAPRSQVSTPAWLPVLDRGPLAAPPVSSALPTVRPITSETPRPGHATRTPRQVAGSDGDISTRATYVVKRGDSLWSISAAHLGAHASASAIAKAWPDLYELNRMGIGSNPRLLLPGQRLTLPASFTRTAA
jgi:nucleoid-associated protein YgaU